MDAWYDELPRSGPFTVKSGSVWTKTLGAVAFGLLILALGIGMFGYGVWSGSEVWRVRTVWADGAEVGEPLSLRGEVTTTNLIFNSYELEVDYMHPQVGVTIAKVDFFTWFTGPSENDPMTLRVLDDPTQAVTSWQADHLWHGVAWAVIAMGMGAVIGGGGAVLLGAAVTTHRRIFRLADRGRIARADIVDVSRAESNGVVTVTLQVRVPPGSELISVNYQGGKSDPVILDETEDRPPGVVVLTDAEGSEAHLMRHDGWPLRFDP